MAAAVLMAAMMPSACGDTMAEFSDHPCRFVFNTGTHAHSAALQSAVTSNGIFCKVTRVLKGGAKHFHFENNHGLKDDVIFTAEDERQTVLLGMNNALWFGYGNLDDPAVFYGYDGECPNCFSPDAIPRKSYPLSVSTAGIARCQACRREYNMNTGGNISKGDKGYKLTRYRASYTGAGVVAVVR